MAIQIAASTGNVYGGTITYDYQVCVDGSSWVDVESSIALSINYTIPETATQFQARVRARDNMGFTSSTWVTGPLVTVRAPWVYHRLYRKNAQQQQVNTSEYWSEMLIAALVESLNPIYT